MAHSPVEGVCEGKAWMRGHTAILTQPLENTALEDKKEQREAPCGNLPNYLDGEDRIRTCGTCNSSRI